MAPVLFRLFQREHIRRHAAQFGVFHFIDAVHGDLTVYPVQFRRGIDRHNADPLLIFPVILSVSVVIRKALWNVLRLYPVFSRHQFIVYGKLIGQDTFLQTFRFLKIYHRRVDSRRYHDDHQQHRRRAQPASPAFRFFLPRNCAFFRYGSLP